MTSTKDLKMFFSRHVLTAIIDDGSSEIFRQTSTWRADIIARRMKNYKYIYLTEHIYLTEIVTIFMKNVLWKINKIEWYNILDEITTSGAYTIKYVRRHSDNINSNVKTMDALNKM